MSHPDAVAGHLRHELRTPINAILGYSQLLLEEADDSGFSAADRADLARVADAGRQLLRIVGEVLEPAGDTTRDVALPLDRLKHESRLPLAAAQQCVESLLEGRDGVPGDDLRRIQSALQAFDVLVAGVERTVPASGNTVTDAVEPEYRGETRTGTVLVVDDEEPNRALLVRRLTRDGHKVLTADGGHTAMAMAAAEAVDVILLDVVMPGLSGYEVLATLKQDAALREIPVLMLTAVDGSESVTRCIALGADDYLPKPFDPVVLAARVGACVAKKRARDFELAYLRGVATVTQAAAAVESGHFIPATLDAIASRSDALGQLARLFQRMAVEVAARERRLEAQVHQLTIAIDERKKTAQVQEITESDYFRDLKARAHQFSGRRAARSSRES
jgi:two-component system, cell cycle response regulator